MWTEEYLQNQFDISKEIRLEDALKTYWIRREAGFKKNRKCNNAKRPKPRKKK